MSYHGVNRIVTVHWHEGWRAREYSIEVVPDPVQAYVGDSITWVVTGIHAPAGITVANFQALDAPPRLRLQKRKVSVMKLKAFPAEKLKVHVDRRTHTYSVTISLDGIAPGWYKYDVVIDQGGVTRVLLDPEVEVRGRPGT